MKTRWGILPDFIGIGPARTGTTWLHEKLQGHVDLPRNIKETKYFERNHARGIEWYANFFKYCKGDRLVAEVCPYLAGPRTPERIFEVLPDCKFIVTPRDPVDRMYSHYKMMRGYAFTKLPVEGAIEADRFLAQGSLYASHLRRWYGIFPREHFLITLYDDLRRSPQQYLDSICDFVGAPRISLAGQIDRRDVINSFDSAPRSFKIAQNARHLRLNLRKHGWDRTATLLGRVGVWTWCAGGGEKFPRLTHEQELHFRELYRPEVEALEELTGHDLSAWKTPREPRGTAAELQRAPAA